MIYYKMYFSNLSFATNLYFYKKIKKSMYNIVKYMYSGVIMQNGIWKHFMRSFCAFLIEYIGVNGVVFFRRWTWTLFSSHMTTTLIQKYLTLKIFVFYLCMRDYPQLLYSTVVVVIGSNSFFFIRTLFFLLLITNKYHGNIYI